MIYVCFIFSLFLVTAEAAIFEKNDINLHQPHWQIILIERDYTLFSIL